MVINLNHPFLESEHTIIHAVEAAVEAAVVVVVVVNYQQVMLYLHMG